MCQHSQVLLGPRHQPLPLVVGAWCGGEAPAQGGSGTRLCSCSCAGEGCGSTHSSTPPTTLHPLQRRTCTNSTPRRRISSCVSRCSSCHSTSSSDSICRYIGAVRRGHAAPTSQRQCNSRGRVGAGQHCHVGLPRHAAACGHYSTAWHSMAHTSEKSTAGKDCASSRVGRRLSHGCCPRCSLQAGRRWQHSCSS